MEPFLKQRAYKIGDWNGVRALLENPYPSLRLAKAKHRFSLLFLDCHLMDI